MSATLSKARCFELRGPLLSSAAADVSGEAFEAEAEVMFRTVADVDVLRALMTQLTPLVAIEEILDVPPVIMPAVPGFDTATFPYTTDIPFLSNWGTPLLYGPGSIHVAHTDNEHVKIADLHRAVEDYAMLAKHLLAS